MELKTIQIQLVINGQVQGVGFRIAAMREATKLGLFGWVRNRPDGSVESLAEGPEETIQSYVDWCHRGPQFARVERVTIVSRTTIARFQFSVFSIND